MDRGAWGLQFMGFQRVGHDLSDLALMHKLISYSPVRKHASGFPSECMDLLLLKVALEIIFIPERWKWIHTYKHNNRKGQGNFCIPEPKEQQPKLDRKPGQSQCLRQHMLNCSPHPGTFITWNRIHFWSLKPSDSSTTIYKHRPERKCL